MQPMRARLVADLAEVDGVTWAALIDPDGFTLERRPSSMTASTVENVGAMWLALPEVLENTQRVTIRGSGGWRVGTALSGGRWLLLEASQSANIGAIRRALDEVGPRIDPL